MTTQTLTQYYCQFCDAVEGFFSNILTKYKQRRQIKSGIQQLHAMTDWELKDIGISRGDINRLANRTDTF